MTRTIGRKWHRRPPYDYPARCDVCGVMWRRSQMVKSSDGQLQCPNDREQTVFELSRANAQAAARIRPKGPPRDR